MNTKLFWKSRKIYLWIVFQIKKTLFNIMKNADILNQKFSLQKEISKTVITQMAKAFIIVFLLIKLDSILLFRTQTMPFELSMFVDVIIGLLGFAGVVLGLYCANIASIFSAKYTNAPKSLSNSYKNDFVTNNCIKQIIGFILICIIMLLFCYAQSKFYWISGIVLTILTVRMVITFSLTGNRSYALSDTFKIADTYFIRIKKVLRKLHKSSIFVYDVNFQNHFQKICNNDILVLEDIANYNKDIPKNQNLALLDYMLNNLSLISFYWTVKPSIHFDSLWFCNMPEYKQWHYATDHEIETATLFGTHLKTDEKRNIWWFEDKIIRIELMCIEKLISDNDWGTFYKYLSHLNNISKNSTCIDAELYWLHHLEEIKDKIVNHLKEIPDDRSYETGNTASIIDAVCCSFISIILGINNSISKFDLVSILKEAKSIKKSPFNFTHNRYINNITCQKMYEQIYAEKAIEKQKITPDWFIEQIVSYEAYKKLNEKCVCVSRLINDIYTLGKHLYDNKNTYASMVAFSHCIALQTKCELFLKYLNTLVPILEKKHIETSIVWEKINLDDLAKHIDNLTIQISPYIIKSSSQFALSHWDKRGDVPDFLGFCYNQLCEWMINSIISEKTEVFKAIYEEFFDFMLLYQEYVRASVIKHKETHLQNRVYHVATAPILEYAIISSLAIIWGEFVENTAWKNIVIEALQKFVDKNPEKHEFILKDITHKIMVRRKAIWGIGNRDTLQTKWEMKVANSIMEHEKFEVISCGYGDRKIKTNSKVMSAFTHIMPLSHLSLNDSEDIYFVLCVNRYLKEEDKYKSRYGWEDNIDER